MPGDQKICVDAKGWTWEEIQLLLDGKWHHPPQSPVCVKRFAVGLSGVSPDKDTVFIAIDTPTWLTGSKNSGLYGFWTDTHLMLRSIQDKVAGFIVQRPVDNVPSSIPQLLVANSYNCIRRLALAARKTYQGKIVAITGTAGKSSTKDMLEYLLTGERSLLATQNNHNSRTGVALMMAALKTQPEVCILEVAVAALWMRDGGICRLVRPHIGIITEIGVGQANITKTPHDTALFKARICESIEPGGYAILNSEMEELDFITEEVKQHGAVPIFYGEAPFADARIISRTAAGRGTVIHAKILDEEIRYQVSVPGKAMAMNSLAALTAAKLLGLELQSIAGKLAALPQLPAVLEFIEVNTGSGVVTVVDDSFNAEILSTIAAFSTVKEQNVEKRRQVALLGRIVNLHTMAAPMHKSMARPFIDAGFQKVFAQGEEMEYMLNELPESMNGGLFYSAETLVEAAAKYIQDGDIVLIKGSRRDSDFNKVRDLLIRALRNRTGQIPRVLYPAAAVYTRDASRILHSEGDRQLAVEEGLGGVLLIYHILRLIADKTISPNELLKITAVPRDAQQARSSFRLQAGDILSLADVLSAFILAGSPDAGIALSDHLRQKTQKSTQLLLQETAEKIGLNPSAVKNVTGRKRSSSGQHYTLDDVSKTAQLLFSLPSHVLEYLCVEKTQHKERKIIRASSLNFVPEIKYFLCFGHGVRNAVALAEVAGEPTIACVLGGRSLFERDYFLAGALWKTANPSSSSPVQAISLPKKNQYVFTLCGDTYFGEWYTERRMAAGHKDALSTHGYSYSFDKLDAFLKKSDFTIVNYEAVLTHANSSPMAGKLEFILKGNPEKTLQEFKKRRIHAVSLANNHSMDYGPKGLVDSLDALQSNEIYSFGAGRNCFEAEQPLFINAGPQKIIVFGAYWHLNFRHFNGYYAQGSHAGSACIWDSLYRNIAAQRALYPDACIIAFVHWNTDYSFLLEQLRPLAEKIIMNGADLIIGHGPHTIAPIEFMHGKPVIYSIGNFVFNNNGGDFKKKKVPAYGLVTRLGMGAGHLSLRLYPIYTFNLETFWQPYPVTEKQFEEVSAFLAIKGAKITCDKDQLGYFFSIEMHK